MKALVLAIALPGAALAQDGWTVTIFNGTDEPLVDVVAFYTAADGSPVDEVAGGVFEDVPPGTTVTFPSHGGTLRPCLEWDLFVRTQSGREVTRRINPCQDNALRIGN